MKTKLFLMAGLLAAPLFGMAASPVHRQQSPEPTEVQAKRLTEADRKVTAGRILLKWGGYVEKVNGQDRRAWAAALWPSLASADLDNLQKASRAVTYEGMRNALLGQRPHDDQIIDTLARSNTKLGASGNPVQKTLGQLAADLVFTPITPCRIVDTRVAGGRIASNVTRDLDASNVGGNFTAQGGSNTNCGIPANPAALALSVTALDNLSTGYIRVYPFDGTNAQGSPVPVGTVNATVTNDMIVPACQGCIQELKVFSTANTHYAAFVSGYFMAPEATALQCVSVSDATPTTILPTGVGSSTSAACTSGYTIVGGECNTALTTTRIVDEDINASTFNCEVFNGSAVLDETLTAVARCCRVPGR